MLPLIKIQVNITSAKLTNVNKAVKIQMKAELAKY